MLRKPQVMGVRGSSAAEQTSLLGNRFDVVPVTNAARLRQGQHALIDHLGLAPASLMRPDRDAAVQPAAQIRSGLLKRVSAASAAKVASFAWKAFSTRWASAAVSLFFSTRHRCAQIAASSPDPRWLSSVRSRSRNSADASGSRIDFAGFERIFPSRRRGAALRRILVTAVQPTIAVPLRLLQP